MTAAVGRLLLVENDRSFSRVLRTTLAAYGYQVDTAERGGEALSLVEVRRPDLVVVDLGLPDIDGLDLIPRLRTFSTAPILVASARDARTAGPAALASGADDYLAKPFGIEHLLAKVRALLSAPARSAADAPERASDATLRFCT